MKTIKMKYITRGRRTNKITAQGFMGPARSPMGKGPLRVGNDYLRPGTLTSAFTLVIPVSGDFELIDCQHNRTILRKVTKDREIFENVKNYDHETGKMVVVRKKLTIPASYRVMDDTPIHEDIITDNPLGDSKEVLELKKRIAELEKDKKPESGRKGGKVKKVPAVKVPPAANATPSGEVAIEIEEDDAPPLTKEQIKAQRFANKAQPADASPIT